eukprot:8028366-Pyramimonas_sp.AAC.1
MVMVAVAPNATHDLPHFRWKRGVHDVAREDIIALAGARICAGGLCNEGEGNIMSASSGGHV